MGKGKLGREKTGCFSGEGASRRGQQHALVMSGAGTVCDRGSRYEIAMEATEWSRSAVGLKLLSSVRLDVLGEGEGGENFFSPRRTFEWFQLFLLCSANKAPGG